MAEEIADTACSRQHSRRMENFGLYECTIRTMGSHIPRCHACHDPFDLLHTTDRPRRAHRNAQTSLGPFVTPPSLNLPTFSTSGAPQTTTFPVCLLTNPCRLNQSTSPNLVHKPFVLVPPVIAVALCEAEGISELSPAPGKAFDKLDPVEVYDGKGVSLGGTFELGSTEATVRSWAESRASSSMDRNLLRSANGGRRSSMSDCFESA